MSDSDRYPCCTCHKTIIGEAWSKDGSRAIWNGPLKVGFRTDYGYECADCHVGYDAKAKAAGE